MKAFLLLLSSAILFTHTQAQQRQALSYGDNEDKAFACYQTISAKAFKWQLAKIRQQPSAAEKRASAKKLASVYCLSSVQVYKLCKVLPLNADKLMIAKRCYVNCPDEDNYDVVFEAMPTTALTNELYDYLVGHGYSPDDDEEYTAGTGNGCRTPMSSAAFEGAKQTIENAGFDETKLESAKTIASTNCLTTEQVISICNLLSFEQSKLDFAKYAYSHTHDKSNYFKVSTVFAFDASKTELNKFIQTAGS